MITEDYVSFETAKLLKEKGFECEKNSITAMYNEIGKFRPLSTAVDEYYYDYNDFDEYDYVAPTLQMAMKWLREKHNQNVTVKAHNNIARLKTIYYAEVENLSEPVEKGFCVNGCIFKDTYEQACEAAIKYCLENLI